jgi:V/A-type H+-transporting ATPase subunit I
VAAAQWRCSTQLPDLRPVRMSRIAIVTPNSHLRAALVRIANSGVVELDSHGNTPRSGKTGSSGPTPAAARIALEAPDTEELERTEQWDLLEGESELRGHAASATVRGPGSVLVGWIPTNETARLSKELAETGTSVVELPRPRFVQPPTLVTGSRTSRAFRPLVDTYGVIPYEDVDPTLFAAITYALMFGMMFGDLGHGLVLALLGVLLSRTSHPTLSRFRDFWVFTVAAGLMAMLFGVLYGEFFGPTGLVPVLWLAPLEEPVTLLVAAIALGALLLAASYVLGIVNRWREGGPGLALYAATGIAGSLLFFGAGMLGAGIVWSLTPLAFAGGAVALLGIVLMFIGFVIEGGSGGSAVAQASIELFDTVIRLGANLVSFGRLAAFGLAHSAITSLVWDGVTGLWGPGLAAAGAVLVFIAGNAIAFALEALVVGVQALRLEYYELFSRILTGEGRRFRPWHVPLAQQEES